MEAHRTFKTGTGTNRNYLVTCCLQMENGQTLTNKYSFFVTYTWKMVKHSLINILFFEEGISMGIMLIEMQQYFI